MAVGRLAISFLATSRIRVALTIAAIAFSVSLVVSVTSGYASVEAAIQQYILQYMGSADAQITRRGDYRGTIPETLVDTIRQDAEVKSAVGRLETESRLLDRNGNPIPMRVVELVGIRPGHDPEIAAMPMEPGTNGRWFESDEGNVAVIDQEAARVLKVSVGDSITLPTVDRKLTVKVTAIVHKPAIFATFNQWVYVPLRTLQEFTRSPGQVTRLMIDLREDGDDVAFAKRWTPRLAKIDPALRLRTARDNRKELDQQFLSLQMLSYLGGAVSMLAAAFIIFSTLSMGVAERTRVLAMLRAVGAVRSQIAMLVVIEAIILAGAGVLIGVPLGWGWVQILSLLFPEFFQRGVILSGGGVLFAVAASTLAAVAAAMIPAWSATRVSPLEGMVPLGHKPRRWGPVLAMGIGICLAGVDPLLLHASFVPRTFAYYGHFVLGLPCLMIGFFLMSPAFVWAIELIFGRIAAMAMRIEYPLLRQQLSGGIWRAAGTASSLMVGLAILVVLQTHGNTLLQGWRLPDRFPDFFIAAPLGVDQNQVAALQTLPEIRRDATGRPEILPIAIAVPGVRSGLDIVALTVVPDATMFLGVDPEMALRMMQLDFRKDDGTRPTPGEQEQMARRATELLKQGRHVIVTDELRQMRGLKIGDTLTLATSSKGDVQYTIAGVVWSPGIDVMVTMFGMGRQFDQRSAATVFGSLEDARRDFGMDKIRLLAVNLDYSAGSKERIEERFRKTLGSMGLLTGDVRAIKHHIQHGFHRITNLVSSVALAAIAVASLGVVNTIMASIRSRRWQLGVLRSIGITRFQLVRMVLAEALLLGLVGSALGVVAGLEMSVNARRFTTLIFGYGPPLDVPWGVVLGGVALIMSVAVLASIWPATSTARSEPLALLQSGRSAA